MKTACQDLEVELAIPVLNEERLLAASVEQILQYCREQDFRNVSVAIADNGSSDATPAIARELVRKWPRVRYVRLDRPALGAAVQEAWRTSKAETLGYMDADLAADLRHLGDAVRLLAQGEWEMVVASRMAPGASASNRSLLRAFVSRVYNEILRRRLHYPGSDAACGFKVLTRRCYERIRAGATLSEGLFFGSELAVRAFALGASVKEIPVEWTDDGRESRIRVLPSAIQFWREMGELKQKLIEQSRLPPAGS